jgi:magnesium-transporting ATPase (P-type)
VEPLSIAIPFPILLEIAFYVFGIIYVVYSLILYYHWHVYAESGRVYQLTTALYFVSTLPLLALMATLAFLSF